MRRMRKALARSTGRHGYFSGKPPSRPASAEPSVPLTPLAPMSELSRVDTSPDSEVPPLRSPPRMQRPPVRSPGPPSTPGEQEHAERELGLGSPPSVIRTTTPRSAVETPGSWASTPRALRLSDGQEDTSFKVSEAEEDVAMSADHEQAGARWSKVSTFGDTEEEGLGLESSFRRRADSDPGPAVDDSDEEDLHGADYYIPWPRWGTGEERVLNQRPRPNSPPRQHALPRPLERVRSLRDVAEDRLPTMLFACLSPRGRRAATAAAGESVELEAGDKVKVTIRRLQLAMQAAIREDARGGAEPIAAALEGAKVKRRSLRRQFSRNTASPAVRRGTSRTPIPGLAFIQLLSPRAAKRPGPANEEILEAMLNEVELLRRDTQAELRGAIEGLGNDRPRTLRRIDQLFQVTALLVLFLGIEHAAFGDVREDEGEDGSNKSNATDSSDTSDQNDLNGFSHQTRQRTGGKGDEIDEEEAKIEAAEADLPGDGEARGTGDAAAAARSGGKGNGKRTREGTGEGASEDTGGGTGAGNGEDYGAGSGDSVGSIGSSFEAPIAGVASTPQDLPHEFRRALSPPVPHFLQQASTPSKTELHHRCFAILGEVPLNQRAVRISLAGLIGDPPLPGHQEEAEDGHSFRSSEDASVPMLGLDGDSSTTATLPPRPRGWTRQRVTFRLDQALRFAEALLDAAGAILVLHREGRSRPPKRARLRREEQLPYAVSLARKALEVLQGATQEAAYYAWNPHEPIHLRRADKHRSLSLNSLHARERHSPAPAALELIRRYGAALHTCGRAYMVLGLGLGLVQGMGLHEESVDALEKALYWIWAAHTFSHGFGPSSDAPVEANLYLDLTVQPHLRLLGDEWKQQWEAQTQRIGNVHEAFGAIHFPESEMGRTTWLDNAQVHFNSDGLARLAEDYMARELQEMVPRLWHHESSTTLDK